MTGSAWCNRYCRCLLLVWCAGPAAFAAAQGGRDGNLPALPADSLPQEIDLELVPLGFPGRPAIPADNPLTMEKIRLGRRLFFDPVLSNNGTIACASCHDPRHGMATEDRLAVGIRAQVGTRNAPSLVNRAWGRSFFWDGRAESLEQQVMGPLLSESELGGDIDGVLRRLKADPDYVLQFAAAFPEAAGVESGDPAEWAVTTQNIARAIASFERTLLSGDSAVDRFRDSRFTALNPSARTGMWIFESRGRCWVCHSGANFTDEKFHNTGVDFGNPDRDRGREIATSRAEDRFRFKTPSLRNVALTAPYQHNGSMASLEEVVAFYSRGGAPDDPGLDPEIQPLHLTPGEQAALVEFLRALTGSGQEMPPAGAEN